MDKELLTKDTYNKIAEKWSRENNKLDFWKEEFKVFSQLLPKGKILDIGCGPGHHSEFLREAGYGYMGVDYSEGLLALAKAKFPDAQFVEGDMLDLPFKENEFDGFWAIASLLHIPKEKIGRALHEIRRVVKSNGIGFIALKKGEGERVVIDEDDKEDKRFFAYWQRDEFEKILKSCEFEVVDFREHVVSEKTTWLSFFVKV